MDQLALALQRRYRRGELRRCVMAALSDDEWLDVAILANQLEVTRQSIHNVVMQGGIEVRQVQVGRGRGKNQLRLERERSAIDLIDVYKLMSGKKYL